MGDYRNHWLMKHLISCEVWRNECTYIDKMIAVLSIVLEIVVIVLSAMSCGNILTHGSVLNPIALF